MTAEPAPLLGSARLNLALIGFLGIMILSALRSDISMAIVCMVNSTAVGMLAGADDHFSTGEKAATCQPRDDTTTVEKDTVMGDLIWSESVQSTVLSSFFWGYSCSQILGGYLASRYSGRLVVGGAILGSSILTLLNPLAASGGAYPFIVTRVLIGFIQGVTFPAFHSMWSTWAPPLERSLLTGITYAGAQIGNVVVSPLSGLLCKHGFAGGWPSIFYVLGLVGILWSVLWFFYAADRPSSSRYISKMELNYIEDSLGDGATSDSKKTKRIPMCAIMKSAPVWALIFGHFAADWGTYIMMTNMPKFMKSVLGLDYTSLGFLTAVPYIAYFIFINLGGFVADKLRNANILSTIATRRLAMIIALGGQAIFLIAASYCGCGQDTLVIIFLTAGMGLSGLQYAGFVVNYLDIAPAYAGTLLGIGNTIACVAGIVSPMLVGLLVPTGSQQGWQLVFWITGGVLIGGVVIFCIFAKDEVQPWALSEPTVEEERELKQKQSNNSESP